jgi:hypothetical protein
MKRLAVEFPTDITIACTTLRFTTFHASFAELTNHVDTHVKPTQVSLQVALLF